MNDGYMHISYIKYPISRFQLIRVLLDFSTGKFIRNPIKKNILKQKNSH